MLAMLTRNPPTTGMGVAVQVIALQASENPAMMAVVSQLQHAIMTMPWPIRCAAAQATAKVRTRLVTLLLCNVAMSVCNTCSAFDVCQPMHRWLCDRRKPYRIHCYSILRSLAAPDLTMGHDFLGAHVGALVPVAGSCLVESSCRCNSNCCPLATPCKHVAACHPSVLHCCGYSNPVCPRGSQLF